MPSFTTLTVRLVLLCVLAGGSLGACSDGSLNEPEAADLIHRHLVQRTDGICTRPNARWLSRWMQEHRRTGNRYALTNMSGYFIEDARRIGRENNLNVSYEQVDGGILTGRTHKITCSGESCGQHIGDLDILIGSSSMSACLDYIDTSEDVAVERIEALSDTQARVYFYLEGHYTSLFSAYEERTGPRTICRPGECASFRDEAVIIPCIGPNGNPAFQANPLPRHRMRQVTQLGEPKWSMDTHGDQCFADFQYLDRSWTLSGSYLPLFASTD